MKRLWFCLCLAYWALLPQFYLLYDGGNRYSLAWTHATHLAVLLAILIIGCAYFAGWVGALWGARRRPFIDKPLRFALSVLVGAIFLRTIISLVDKGGLLSPEWQSQMNARPFKLGIYLLPFIGAIWNPQMTKLISRALFLTLSIMLSYFLVFPWFWPTYGWTDQMPSSAANKYGSKTNSIYIFCFDGWSFTRTFADPDQMARMPGLTELMEHADLYTKARAPDFQTPSSIPRFLFQTDQRMRELHSDELGRMVRNNLLSRQGFQSIFDLTDNHFKALLGCYLYYPAMFGRKLDYYGRYNPNSDRVRTRRFLCSLLASQTEFTRHLGLTRRRQLPNSNFDTDLINIQKNTKKTLLEVLHRLPQMNIAYFHVLFPHYPYQFQSNGSERNPILMGADASNLEGYRDNLEYMDQLIKDIVLALQQRGDYDSSLIVLLSDHSWRHDPEIMPLFGDYKAGEKENPMARPLMQHVPLIIKHPNQAAPRRFDQEVELSDLYRLFARYLDNSEETMELDWWRQDSLSIP